MQGLAGRLKEVDRHCPGDIEGGALGQIKPAGDLGDLGGDNAA